MKYKLSIIVLLLTISIFLTSCNDWVTDTDPLIDNVQDDVLDDPALMDFLITGVNGHLSEAVALMFAEADLLSDQLEYNSAVGGTFTSFQDIDNGLQASDRSGAFNEIHNLRHFSEDLAKRAAKIGVERKDVSYTGLFNSAVGYQLLASYWALEPGNNGSPVDGGPMVSSEELYNRAITNFTNAIPFAANENAKRQIYTYIAKCQLYLGNFAQAKAAAQNGLQNGDEPFQVLYTDVADAIDENYYYSNFGPGRYQGVPDPRFQAFVDANSNESNRTPLKIVNNFPVQDKYKFKTSPIVLVSWQENELILAETSIRDGNNADALSRINNVRASHSISPLTSVTMDDLIVERDKELFLTGTRLLDQRRFNIWHLGSDAWDYFPIPDNERNSNENL